VLKTYKIGGSWGSELSSSQNYCKDNDIRHISKDPADYPFVTAEGDLTTARWAYEVVLRAWGFEVYLRQGRATRPEQLTRVHLFDRPWCWRDLADWTALYPPTSWKLQVNETGARVGPWSLSHYRPKELVQETQARAGPAFAYRTLSSELGDRSADAVTLSSLKRKI
jgi:hypothetical protein